MKYKVYVDGQEGTTGLKIHERLKIRDDIELLQIDPKKRKDADERGMLLNQADIAFLCLPDAAAIEAVSLVTNNKTKIIDASTAHRTNDEWAYGIPELSEQHREKIKSVSRVTVPGCHASGFNMLVYPLVQEGIVSRDYPLSCFSVTGYSGGGKKLIDLYENAKPKDENLSYLESPCLYSLELKHKHLPEMKKACGLPDYPLFTPILGNFYQGMTVSVPLNKRLLNKKYSANEIRDFFAEYYKACRFISIKPFGQNDLSNNNGHLPATSCNGTNNMDIFVFGHEDQILLCSRFDNLGKGSSGAAVQNMNIMLGIDEHIGL